MASTTPGGRSRIISDINVTPLVDVVLVLLVVMMVTAGYIVSKTIPVDLPRAQTGQSVARTIAISIDADGRTYVDGRAVTEDQLQLAIRASRRGDTDARAVIAADGSVAHRQVVRAIDLLRREGVERFAINVQPDEVRPH